MIIIETYKESWPEEFVEIARELREAIGEQALRIDHIGSTAVPGLAAKDRVDIQLTIENFEKIDELERKLGQLGYRMAEDIRQDHRPPLIEGPDTDWEKRYCWAPEKQRPTNMHIRALGRPNQRYPLLFRDYLREHPEAAATYGLIKNNLAERHRDDIEYYYDIKDPVCDLIIQAAEEWAKRTEWQIGPRDM